jgi:hypothetical protein
MLLLLLLFGKWGNWILPEQGWGWGSRGGGMGSWWRFSFKIEFHKKQNGWGLLSIPQKNLFHTLEISFEYLALSRRIMIWDKADRFYCQVNSYFTTFQV